MHSEGEGPLPTELAKLTKAQLDVLVGEDSGNPLRGVSGRSLKDIQNQIRKRKHGRR